ncbi:MAG: hypothetical protein ABIO43_01890 [Sphingomicrobium sp.]
MIGQHVLRLSVQVGSGWGGGYSVDVVPAEYAVIEHANCPNAKETAAIPQHLLNGLCVARINREQSSRFEAAMDQFRGRAVPLQSFLLENQEVRPDGKPCRIRATDSTDVSLVWSGTEGVKIATFYLGCDTDEFGAFYKSLLAVTDPLPIQHIIGEH